MVGLLEKAWAGRQKIAIGAASGLIFGFIFYFSLTPVYESSMIIAPRNLASEERSMNVLSDGSSSSRGFSVSSEIPREFIRFQQVFREPTAAAGVVRLKEVQSRLENDSMFHFSSDLGLTTADEVSRYLKRSVTLRQIGPTSSQLISYRHPDPVFAARFLMDLHRVTDEMIREDAKQQTEKKIIYLQNALQENYNPDHRKALVDLLMLEERNRMLVSMDRPYAADIIEPASVAAKPVSPKAAVIFPAFVLIGAFFGFLYFLFRDDAVKE